LEAFFQLSRLQTIDPQTLRLPSQERNPLSLPQTSITALGFEELKSKKRSSKTARDPGPTLPKP
jgi:hypothetical protein